MFLSKVYPGYGQQSDDYFKQFVGDIVKFLCEELKAISEFFDLFKLILNFLESDSGFSNTARFFAALAPHINQTDANVSKNYIELAISLFKLTVNSCPSCATSGAIALATSDLSSDLYPDSLFDTIKTHIPILGNPTTPSDFTFFTTLLFVKLAREPKNRGKATLLLPQILASDAYTKEKYLTGLSRQG
jgi:hypothetical protein